MPTYIDESGDTGPVHSGGKPYFRLAAVWVPTHDDSAEFREKVRRLRREFGLRPDYEFKFANTHHRPQWREAFFNSALTQEFRFAFSRIDKTDPYWNFTDGPEQHWACTTELAALLRPIYCRAIEGRSTSYKERIVVDDNADDAFLAVVKRQFRGLRLKSTCQRESPLVGRVSFRDSAADEMLQLADMVCGATGAFIDDGERIWYDLISARDVELR